MVYWVAQLLDGGVGSERTAELDLATAFFVEVELTGTWDVGVAAASAIDVVFVLLVDVGARTTIEERAAGDLDVDTLLGLLTTLEADLTEVLVLLLDDFAEVDFDAAEVPAELATTTAGLNLGLLRTDVTSFDSNPRFSSAPAAGSPRAATVRFWKGALPPTPAPPDPACSRGVGHNASSSASEAGSEDRKTRGGGSAERWLEDKSKWAGSFPAWCGERPIAWALGSDTNRRDNSRGSGSIVGEVWREERGERKIAFRQALAPQHCGPKRQRLIQHPAATREDHAPP